MKSMHGSRTVELLTPIWMRVLQLSSVDVDDNFFELGGDSAQALELFHQVALAFGRELQPVMIYQTPTIAALAAALEEPDSGHVPPVVQLRTGTTNPPAFFAHGVGGSVIDFYQVVKNIQTPHAIYGLQAKGIHNVEAPLERIEDMAAYSLNALLQVQPHGPYILVGFSLGGLLVLEMAQRLKANGEKIGLLAMLDSYPSPTLLSLGQRARLNARQTWRRVAKRLQWLGVKPPFQTILENPASPSTRPFREAAYRALEHYRPSFYPGKINFIRATIPTDFPADPRVPWGKFVQQLEVQSVPGDHLGIMTSHAEGLGAALTVLLKNAAV